MISTRDRQLRTIDAATLCMLTRLFQHSYKLSSRDSREIWENLITEIFDCVLHHLNVPVEGSQKGGRRERLTYLVNCGLYDVAPSLYNAIPGLHPPNNGILQVFAKGDTLSQNSGQVLVQVVKSRRLLMFDES